LNILAENLRARIITKMTHLALDRFRRVRPGSFGVRIVIGPHEIIDQLPFLRELKPGAILLKGRSAVAAEIFAR
jgi:hypothetical protein